MPAKYSDAPQEYTIVWGASGGVGLEMTKRLASSGKHVLAYVRNVRDVATLEKLHSGIIARVFKIEEAFYLKEAEFLKEQGYNITGMVDCVGSITSEPGVSLTQRLDDVMKPNLYHQYFTATTFKELLRPNSSIVFISSIRAFTGVDNPSIEYAFAKAALENLTKSLMYAFGERQIRVNCIRPTPIIETKISGAWPQSLVDSLTNQSVFKKLLLPSDVVDVAEFLLSDQSASITGAVIDTNNGFALLH